MNKTHCPNYPTNKGAIDENVSLYFDGSLHSDGIIDRTSGIYITFGDQKLPTAEDIVMTTDSGDRLQISAIDKCPHGEAHHHFAIDKDI